MATCALVVAFLSGGPLWAQANPPGTPPLPDFVPGRDLQGQAAINAIGDRMPAFAAHYGVTVEELTEHLASDGDLWLYQSGELVFGDSFLPDDEDVAGAAAEGSAGAAGALDLGQTFLLHSRPSAERKIYLDFDGHTSTEYWNNWRDGTQVCVTPVFSTDSDDAFSDSEKERIQYIWQRVVEDFAGFDVDVTTEDPGIEALRKSDASDNAYGIRVCIGGSSGDWYRDPATGAAGGVANIGSFDHGVDRPCYVFTDNLGNGSEKYTAEACSHEVGHTVNLFHDGTSSVVYYQGHGTSPNDWAPIMGNSYYRTVTQFSKGEYPDANNSEDDLVDISLAQHMPYLTDDYGSSFASPSALPVTAGAVSASGLIERTSDVDMFQFSMGEGNISLTIDVASRSPNLNVEAKLYDSNQVLVSTSSPTDSMGASFSLTAQPAGTYFLSVDGVGYGDLSTGFSDYGSLGAYTISGTVPIAGGPVAIASANPTSGNAPLTVSFDGSASYDADPPGGTLTYSWNMGDGTTYAVESPSHTYTGGGNFTASLTVTDTDSYSSTDSVQITVSAIPPAPINLVASPACNTSDPSYGAIALTWQVEPYSNADDYEVFWSYNGIDGWSSGGGGMTTTGLSYTHTWLDVDETLYYRVVARNSSGSSAPSNVASATTYDIPWFPPSSLNAQPGATSTSMEVTWSLENASTGYSLDRSLDGSTWQTISLPADDGTPADGTYTYLDTGLQSGTTYHYRVEALGTCGYTTGYSSAVQGTTTTLVSVGAISGNTTESGGTASFSIVLTQAPIASVTIPLSSTDPTEGTVPSSVSFDASDWNTPKQITVTGVEDYIVDGDVSFTIVTGAASSSDPAFDGLTVPDVAALNEDNDMPVVTTYAPDSGGLVVTGNYPTDPPGYVSNLGVETITEGLEEVPAQYPAQGDLPDAGEVVGSFADIEHLGGESQKITEVQSKGGKPSSRHTFLRHGWDFGTLSSPASLLHLNGVEVTGGESFRISLSVDGGAWTEVLTVGANADYPDNAVSIPASSSVRLQVETVNQEPGESNLGSFSVDQIVFEGVGYQTSSVEYRWTFIGVDGAETFNAVATTGAVEEGFDFAHSTDGGSTWTPLGTIANGDSGLTADLSSSPVSAPTTLLRLVDNNRSAGVTNLDSIAVESVAFEATQNDLRTPVEVTASSTPAREAGSVSTSFTFTRPGDDISADLPVSFVLTGTAEPSDYTTDPAGLVVTILAGFDTATLTVTPEDDLDGEGPETVTVTLDDADTNPFRPGFSSSASVTIEDDDLQLYTPTGESTVAGSVVSGSYTDLAPGNPGSQTLEERESGGRKSTRYTFLEHVYNFGAVSNVRSFTGVIDSTSTSGPNDHFQLQYSVDGAWIDLGPQISAGLTSQVTIQVNFDPPLSTSGGNTLQVRVIDTDQSQGEREKGRITISELSFSTLPTSLPAPGARKLAGGFVDPELNQADPGGSPTLFLTLQDVGQSDRLEVHVTAIPPGQSFHLRFSTDGQVFVPLESPLDFDESTDFPVILSIDRRAAPAGLFQIWTGSSYPRGVSTAQPQPGG